MTFSKGFLITVFSLALFAFSSPVTAATTETKPAAAAKTDAKAEVKTEPKTEAAPAPTAAPAPAAIPEKIPVLERAQQKIDIKNLPKNLATVVPKDGDVFILGVGETKPFAAVPGRKCLEDVPPSFETAKLRIPPTDLMSFSDGGLGERFTRRCGGLMKARVIFATGTKPGTQKMIAFFANLTIIVK